MLSECVLGIYEYGAFANKMVLRVGERTFIPLITAAVSVLSNYCVKKSVTNVMQGILEEGGGGARSLARLFPRQLVCALH